MGDNTPITQQQGPHNMPTMLFRMNQPEALVDELVAALPEELFTSSTTTFCDPAMGKGDYLVGVAKRLLKYGHMRDNILSRLYGFETSQLYINACENMTPLKGANLTVMRYDDVLAGGITMKFDCIVGNPPFQDSNRIDNANKLWPRFVKKSWELIADKGVMALITPNGWMTPGADIGKGETGFNIFRDIMKQANPLVLHVDNKSLSKHFPGCLLYTSPSPRDRTRSRMPSSA